MKEHSNEIGGALLAGVAAFVVLGLTALGSKWAPAIAVIAFVLAFCCLVGAVLAFRVKRTPEIDEPPPVDPRAALRSELMTVADEIATLVDTRATLEPKDTRTLSQRQAKPNAYRDELNQYRKETLATYFSDLRSRAVNSFDQAIEFEAARQVDRAWVDEPPDVADLETVTGLLRHAARDLKSPS